MEPLVLSAGSRHRGALGDLAVDLTAASAGFRRSLPPGVVRARSNLVRSMNCYYSNLIEGHATHPIGAIPRRVAARRCAGAAQHRPAAGAQGLSALLERGALASESTRAPLTLTFPATLAPRWMPGLFPEKTS